MKERGSYRNKKMLKRALMGYLCISSGSRAESAESTFLRKGRLDRPKDSIVGSASVDEETLVHDELSKMEDLWEKAAAAAKVELDAERILWQMSSSADYDDMSMPAHAPTWKPPTWKHPTWAPPPPSPRPNPMPVAPTVSCFQGRTRQEYIFDILVTVTPGTVLNDINTPQGQAYDYLANNDPYLAASPCANTIAQRYALTTMFLALGGFNWQNSQGWLGQNQECQWFGVDCLGNNPELVTRVLLRKYDRWS